MARVGDWFKPRRVMGIALRLSVVVGVIGGVGAFVEMHQRYSQVVGDRMRISAALRCAQAFTDEQLAAYKNAFGNIDISKVHCAPTTFWASLDQVRNVHRVEADLQVPYGHYVSAEGVLGAAVIWAGLVVLLGAVIVALRYITLWVLGL